MPDHHDPVEIVGTAVERELLRLAVMDGLPRDLVLSAALSRVVSIIVAVHGGSEAAEICRIAADKVEALPNTPPSPLATMPAAGRA